jgi:hypothetical protein
MRWYLVGDHLTTIADVLRRLWAKGTGRQGKSPVPVSHFAIPRAAGRVHAFVPTLDGDFAHAGVRRDLNRSGFDAGFMVEAPPAGDALL